MASRFPAIAVVCLCTFAWIAAHAAEGAASLVLEATIPLPDVAGRIDHLTIDLARKRLIVAELGNGSVDVIDLNTSKVVHRISGLDEPQGVVYLPKSDLIVVSCGGDGTVKFYGAADFSERGVVQLGADADNVRLDPGNGTVLVGYGEGGIARIDPIQLKKIADAPLPGHPEGFQISQSRRQVFANVPDTRHIYVIDIDASSHTPTAQWDTRGSSANFPMALDEMHQTVAVAFRSPARLALFDAGSGAQQASLETCGDADDVYFDEKRQRYYVSCGSGFISVFDLDGAGLHAREQIPSGDGARTSLFVAEMDRLFVAVRAGWFGSSAAIQIYRPNS